MVMTTILVILLLIFSKSHALLLPSNSSTFPQSLYPEPPPINLPLNEALEAIAAKERWDLDGGIRVSELDPISVRVGGSQRYELHVRVGRTVLMMKLSDGIVVWRKPGGFGSDLEFDGGFGEGPKPSVRGLELEGPMELRADGGIDEEISLLLPALNATYGGLRRILVGDGITIKVDGAQDVTLFHPYDIGLLLERSSLKANQDSNQFWPFGLPSCAPLLSVRFTGSASVVAFRAHNSEAHVKTLFRAADNIELLSEKCYNNGHFKQVPSWTFNSLSSKLVILQKALRSFLGNNIILGRSARLLKAKITASNLVRFRLEVEREITENDGIWKWVAAWRTKPMVERIWFEIVARVEADKGWKQMVVRKLTRPIMAVESSPWRKLTRPIMAVESSPWSNLMSNISFTQIPSIVLPPEALTLDVHW